MRGTVSEVGEEDEEEGMVLIKGVVQVEVEVVEVVVVEVVVEETEVEVEVELC